MYEGTVAGKTLVFTNKAYKSMVSRFNPERIKKLSGDEDTIKIKCLLCASVTRTMRSCRSCPFVVFERESDSDAGCIHAMRKAISPRMFQTIRVDEEELVIGANRKLAIQYFEKIQAVLAGFKKV